MKACLKRQFQTLQGFTLIELLVVISIIGILATLIFANFVGVRARGRDAVRKSDIKQIQNALRMYYNDNQKYPQGAFGSCDSGSNAWSNLANFLSPKYISNLPVDPLNRIGDFPEVYCYYYTSNRSPIDPPEYFSPDDYVLAVRLENQSDPVINYDPGSGCAGYRDISSGLKNFYGACSANYVVLSP